MIASCKKFSKLARCVAGNAPVLQHVSPDADILSLEDIKQITRRPIDTLCVDQLIKCLIAPYGSDAYYSQIIVLGQALDKISNGLALDGAYDLFLRVEAFYEQQSDRLLRDNLHEHFDQMLGDVFDVLTNEFVITRYGRVQNLDLVMAIIFFCLRWSSLDRLAKQVLCRTGPCESECMDPINLAWTCEISANIRAQTRIAESSNEPLARRVHVLRYGVDALISTYLRLVQTEFYASLSSEYVNSLEERLGV